MILEIFATILLGIYFLHLYTSKNFDYWKKRNVPYLEPKPLVGNFLDVCLFRCDLGRYIGKIHNSCDYPFLGIFIYTRPALLIRDPEIIKHVLITDFSFFTDRMVLNGDYEPESAHMLFNEKGAEWRIMRSKMSTSFSNLKLKSMFKNIEDIAKKMAAFIATKCESDYLEAKGICCRFSTDVISRCAFAIDSNSFNSDQESDFQRVGKRIFAFGFRNAISFYSHFFFHSIAKLFQLRFLDAEAVAFLRKVFWESIRLREEMNIEGNDILDIIVELRKNKEFCNAMKFEGDKVIAQALVFFAAGFETTASTIGFVLYELALHQDVQHKLRDEIKRSIEKTETTSFESITDIVYLSMVIKETLRKYPVLPFVDRVCNRDYKIPGTDCVIEKGTPIIVSMSGLHKDPRFYEDPEKFLPERFEQNGTKKADFTFMPFGKGPRTCIGERFGYLATKIAIVHILNEFQVEPCDKTPVPLFFDPRSILLQSRIGLPLKFRKTEKLFQF